MARVDNDVQITIRLPASWLEEVEKIARRSKPMPVKRAHMIRAALRAGLDKLAKAGGR